MVNKTLLKINWEYRSASEKCSKRENSVSSIIFISQTSFRNRGWRIVVPASRKRRKAGAESVRGNPVWIQSFAECCKLHSGICFGRCSSWQFWKFSVLNYLTRKTVSFRLLQVLKALLVSRNGYFKFFSLPLKDIIIRIIFCAIYLLTKSGQWKINKILLPSSFKRIISILKRLF